MLAKVYGISIDSLMESEEGDSTSIIPPAPPGKNIWGTVTIGERGQIVIPKAARDRFGFKSGDRLVVLSDEVGIALLPTEFFEKMMSKSRQ
jgi:AbrB family looped-hinge helix DNA binding protein